jgi:pimeloyl-ACP methyl ester carboxylesterase
MAREFLVSLPSTFLFPGALSLKILPKYVMDVRGYGRSTRPQWMEEPPNAHAPLVRLNEAADDISAVVEAICTRRGVAHVALFGWATGGQWAGYYASAHPVSALISLKSLYRGSSPEPFIGRGTDSEDPTHPGRFNPASCGAYRFNDAASLLRRGNAASPWKTWVSGAIRLSRKLTWTRHWRVIRLPDHARHQASALLAALWRIVSTWQSEGNSGTLP